MCPILLIKWTALLSFILRDNNNNSNNNNNNNNEYIEVAQRFLANQKWRSILNESLLDYFLFSIIFSP